MSTDLGVEFWGSVLDSSLLMDKENLPLALFVFVSTLYAFSYLRFKTCPISWKGANWRQQVLTVQVPDTPWHLHLVFTWPFTTFIPTLLLCWLTLAVTSLPSVFARRRNRLVNLRANLILSPHPPHFHASTLFRCLDSSHVHLSICPLRHPLAKVWTKLADDTA